MMTDKTSNGRILYFDLAKYVAISLVVIGHSYLLTIGWQSHLRGIIYSFHMPLFFFISGFFSLSAFSKHPLLFIKQKSLQLLLPVFSCIAVQCLLLSLWGEKGFLRDEIVGGVWFLKVLFMCYAICYSMYQLKLLYFGGGISCLLLFVIPGGGILKLNLMFLFFFLGVIYRKYHHTVKSVHFCRIVFVSTSLFLYLALSGNAGYEPKITLSYLYNYPMKTVITFLSGITGTIMVLGLCKLYMKAFDGKVTELFLKVGKYTLGIYIVQIILVERVLVHYLGNCVDKVIVNLNDYIITPIIGIVLTFVCYGVVKVLKKNRFINLLFFGNQY